MKKYLILGLMFLFSLSFVLGATESLVDFTYDFNTTSEVISNKLHNPPILLRIETPSEIGTNCYYSETNGSFYGSSNNLFEWEGTVYHEQRFHEEDLVNGMNTYYVQCGNTSNPILEVSFDVLKEISATIILSEEDPLKAGVYDVTLITSRSVSGEPTLEYSVDNIVYDPLPLERTGNNWKTKIIIENNLKETIGSFKFKATDSAGRIGTRIEKGSNFLIDTIAPSPIEDLEAIGHLGEIELTWYLDDDIEEFIIFRSENPGVDKNDDIESVDDEDYIDTDVENGKTYYYKIQAIDEAGNKGSLSREISATALIYETDEETGLSQNLLGKVDNLLTEISLLEEDIKTIQKEISNKDETEKNLFEEFGLTKEITTVLSEISSLEKDVERNKLQSLTENELDTKLNQARLRLDILRKRVPESLTITGEFEIQRELSLEKIDLMVLEYGQEILTEKEQKRTSELTETLITDSKISIESQTYVVEVNYLDGTTAEKTIIIDTITGEIEKMSEVTMLLSIPNDLAQRASEIDLKTGSEEVIKEDLLLGFDSDIKKIVYVLDKKINPSQIEDILILPLYLYEETNTESNFLTGFITFQGNEVSNTQIGVTLGIIAIILLALYYVIIRKNKDSEELIKISELVKQGKKHKKNGAIKELKKIYSKIKASYEKLTKEEKEKIFKKIKKLHE